MGNHIEVVLSCYFEIALWVFTVFPFYVNKVVLQTCQRHHGIRDLSGSDLILAHFSHFTFRCSFGTYDSSSILVSTGLLYQYPQKVLSHPGLCKSLAVVFSHSLLLWMYCFPKCNVTYLSRNCISLIHSEFFPIIHVLFQLNLLQHCLGLKGFCIQTFFQQYFPWEPAVWRGLSFQLKR